MRKKKRLEENIFIMIASENVGTMCFVFFQLALQFALGLLDLLGLTDSLLLVLNLLEPEKFLTFELILNKKEPCQANFTD